MEELIRIVEENPEIADRVLRGTLINVLENMKRINAQKIDSDLKGLKEGVEFNKLFSDKETSNELFKLNQSLMFFIKITKEGYRNVCESIKKGVKNGSEVFEYLEIAARQYGEFVKDIVENKHHSKIDNLFIS